MSGVQSIFLRRPELKDGPAVTGLINSCPPLDTNSAYCNLLQCSHFSGTSVIAETDADKDIAGFISGYVIPERADTLFIWQVAVAESARGQKLASRMLSEILKRPECGSVRYLETTITLDNQASWALFRSFAREKKTELHSSEWMNSETHFAGAHDSEILVRIGPFNSDAGDIHTAGDTV